MAALGVHQHRVEGQRAALPLEPRAFRPAGDIGRIRPLQHQPLDAALARAVAQFAQFVPARERHQRRQVEPFPRRTRMPSFETAPALGEGEAAQILRPLAQYVVEPHRRRIIAQHLRGRRLAVESLLQIVERRHLAVAHDQELAVERHLLGHRRADIRERPRRSRRPNANRAASARRGRPAGRGCRPISTRRDNRADRVRRDRRRRAAGPASAG